MTYSKQNSRMVYSKGRSKGTFKWTKIRLCNYTGFFFSQSTGFYHFTVHVDMSCFCKSLVPKESHNTWLQHCSLHLPASYALPLHPKWMIHLPSICHFVNKKKKVFLFFFASLLALVFRIWQNLREQVDHRRHRWDRCRHLHLSRHLHSRISLQSRRTPRPAFER